MTNGRVGVNCARPKRRREERGPQVSSRTFAKFSTEEMHARIDDGPEAHSDFSFKDVFLVALMISAAVGTQHQAQ